jgi:Grx4 family monothiol glutaredoxin
MKVESPSVYPSLLQAVDRVGQEGNNMPTLPCLYIFHAQWSVDSTHHLQDMQSILDGYTAQWGWRGVDTDCEEGGRMVERYGIERIPSCVLVDTQGNVLERMGGGMEVEEIIERVERTVGVYWANKDIQCVRVGERAGRAMHRLGGVGVIGAEGGQGFKGVEIEDKDTREWIEERTGKPLPQIYKGGEIVLAGQEAERAIREGKVEQIIGKKTDQETLQEILGEERAILLVRMGTGSTQEEVDRCRQCMDIMDKAGLLYRYLDLSQYPSLVPLALSMFPHGSFPLLYSSSKAVSSGEELLSSLSTRGYLEGIFPGGMVRGEYADIEDILREHRIVVFMKGTVDSPVCGYSAEMVSILNGQGVEYTGIDILGRGDMRDRLKTYAQWTTYPQLWIEGELIGGIDIVKEMIENGEWKERIEKMKGNK